MKSSISFDFSTCFNAALNKPASQSSFSRWSRPNESALAVNGKKTGRCSFHTERELHPWWQVDLGANYPIEAIVIWNREDKCAERASSLQLEVSADAETWDLIHRGLSYFGGVKSGRPFLHLLSGNVRARFVRISLTVFEHLHLDEVEIFVANNFFVAQRLWKAWKLPGEPSNAAMLEHGQYAVHGDIEPQPVDHVGALEVLRFGRFGNNLHQILNAAMIASVLGVRDIGLFGDPLFDLAGAAAEARNPRFVSKVDTGSRLRLVGHFFHLDDFEGMLNHTRAADWNQTLIDCIRPLYAPLIAKVRPAEAGIMHFHFRSGDIFGSETVHADYAQPPVAYYVMSLSHAMTTYGVQKAVLVFEDRANPCVDAFISHLDAVSFPYTLQSASLEEDLAILLGARILCFSAGTFCESVAALSESVAILYAFQRVEFDSRGAKLPGRGLQEIFRLRGLNRHRIDIAAGEYIGERDWKNTAQQRGSMTSFPIENLRLTTLEDLPEAD